MDTKSNHTSCFVANLVEIHWLIATEATSLPQPHICIQITVHNTLSHTYSTHTLTQTHTFVGSCLATKVFIGNLPAMGRGWVIIK